MSRDGDELRIAEWRHGVSGAHWRHHRREMPPGMNAAGEVVDIKQVEAGHGQTVKGINDFTGEITGIPAPFSKFTVLQISMPLRLVMDLCGPPTDQGVYITGKRSYLFTSAATATAMRWPTRDGAVRYFAGGSLGDVSGGNLIWIIHAANKSEYR